MKQETKDRVSQEKYTLIKAWLSLPLLMYCFGLTGFFYCSAVLDRSDSFLFTPILISCMIIVSVITWTCLVKKFGPKEIGDWSVLILIVLVIGLFVAGFTYKELTTWSKKKQAAVQIDQIKTQLVFRQADSGKALPKGNLVKSIDLTEASYGLSKYVFPSSYKEHWFNKNYDIAMSKIKKEVLSEYLVSEIIGKVFVENRKGEVFISMPDCPKDICGT